MYITAQIASEYSLDDSELVIAHLPRVAQDHRRCMSSFSTAYQAGLAARLKRCNPGCDVVMPGLTQYIYIIPEHIAAVIDCAPAQAFFLSMHILITGTSLLKRMVDSWIFVLNQQSC